MEAFPQILADELAARDLFELAAFFQAHQLPPETSIRINPKKQVTSVTEHLQNVPWCPYGYYLEQRPVFTLDPLLHAGAYYVQEASSMFLWQILSQLNVDRSAHVLDLCAAPGGKTTLLASYCDQGVIVANEVIKNRASILVENITKWGTGNIIVTNDDPKHFERMSGMFDVLVIDAPCSGSGLFRRETDWLDEWTAANVHHCAERQKRILADSFAALKEGGILIYSTCSYSREEDENIVDWIMKTFSVKNISLTLDNSWGIETSACNKEAVGYRFFPHKLRGEGFFTAVFRKESASSGIISNEGILPKLTKDEAAAANHWISDQKDLHLFKQGEHIQMIQSSFLPLLLACQQYLYIKKAGTCIGQLKVKGLVPDHDLALSIYKKDALPSIALDKENAVRYLKKQDLNISTDSSSKGIVLATYKGLGLGWMKILPNRINNYYPSEWRILMQ